MQLYPSGGGEVQEVEVGVSRDQMGGSRDQVGGSRDQEWAVQFTPPAPGIAHLSLKLDGVSLKNSPYVLTIRALTLEPGYLGALGGCTLVQCSV